MVKLSSYQVIDEPYETSVLYNDLYIIDGKICYVTDQYIDLPAVNKFINNYVFKPKIYTESVPEVINSIELAALSDCLWYGNIGHALWDGIYPIYLALCKFNLENESFDYLTTEMSNHNTIAYSAIKTFIGGNIYQYDSLDMPVTHIKKLVAGTGSAGNVVMRPDYTTYGNKYDALNKFKNRMYERHFVKCKSKNEEVNIIWIDNKRYTQNERIVIQRIIEERGDIKYVSYPDYKTFTDHLSLIGNTDIQITGPGTAMIYIPFLRFGGVNVNLGYMEHTQKNTARPNIYIDSCINDNYQFPGYMEQSLCNACHWTSSLYYDRYTHNELEYNSLNQLINQAISLSISGKILPSHHNIDAKIYVEYCNQVDHAWELSNYMTNKAFFIELFINEHPYALPPYVNLELLRQIKDQYGYNRSYEYRA